MPLVHPAALVDAHADLASDVVVGPFAVVEAGVTLGPRCVVHAHAVLRGRTILGPDNAVHPFAVLGGEPQAKRHVGEVGRLEIGPGNVFREHVTVHGGTEDRVTRIGAGNLIMVGAHVGHDAVIGSQCVVANGVQLAGHVVVEDWVTFGGLSGVAQHVRVGESAFVAAAAACERDVPPFVVVQGDRARIRGVNAVGLRRRHIPEASVDALRRAAHVLWRSKWTQAEAIRRLGESTDPYVRRLLEALEPR